MVVSPRKQLLPYSWVPVTASTISCSSAVQPSTSNCSNYQLQYHQFPPWVRSLATCCRGACSSCSGCGPVTSCWNATSSAGNCASPRRRGQEPLGGSALQVRGEIRLGSCKWVRPSGEWVFQVRRVFRWERPSGERSFQVRLAFRW